MKYLLVAVLLSGCSLAKYPMYRDHKKAEVSSMDKLEKCIFRLIEKDGIKGTDANTICSSIYRRE